MRRINSFSSVSRFAKRTGHISQTMWMLIAATLICSGLLGCESAWKKHHDSPRQLCLAVVDALNRKDIEKMNGLRIQREEYLAWVWPAFPASRPPSNFPGDFAWANLNKNCNIGMKKSMERYGGKNLTFVDIRFTKPTVSYDGFQLFRGTVLTLRNHDGKTVEPKILGAVIAKDNFYKFLSYKA